MKTLILAPLFLFFAMDTSSPNLKFHFSQGNDHGWVVVNDNVMGGVSEGGFSVNKEGILEWTGELSLRNNGGFASIRAPKKDYSFQKMTGFRMRLRTDAHQYGLTVSTTRYFTGYSYRAEIDAPAGEWTVLEVPFSEFALRYFGELVPDSQAQPLDPGQIVQFGLLLADKDTSPFRLELDWLEVY